MGDVVVGMSVSLDGMIAGPGGDLGWHLVDDELHTHFNDTLAAAGAFLEGRVMFELMQQFWPTADADPDAPLPIVRFAQIWRETPKVVFSRTLDHDPGGNATVVREVTPEVVAALKREYEGELALGGAGIAASFAEQGLVDGYRLYVHPVVVGAGRRLFPEGGPQRMSLIDTHRFGNGVVRLDYRVEH